MRRMRKDKKGQELAVWIFALIFIFMISLIYIIMTQPFVFIRDKFAPNFTGTEFEDTFNKIDTFWKTWPVLLIFGVIIWALVSSAKQTPRIPF